MFARSTLGVLAATAAVALMVTAAPRQATAHCQVPCGIYGDDARFDTLEEHFVTLEKAMKKIVELSKADDPNYNQIVRWVNTKEDHADQIVDILTHYFLMQRIKVPTAKKKGAASQERYERMLRAVHSMLLHTMKAKQTTDLSEVDALRHQAHRLKHLYDKK